MVINKDGHLITADYVLPKAPEHNRVLSNAPSIHFDFTEPQLLERACVVCGCTRLRLVSGFAKLELVEEVSSTLQNEVHWTLDSHSN